MRADDIIRQRFTKVFRGYDVQEVDLFLDEVIRTIEGLEKERDMLLSRLEGVLRELEQYDAAMYMHQSLPPMHVGGFASTVQPVGQPVPQPTMGPWQNDFENNGMR